MLFVIMIAALVVLGILSAKPNGKYGLLGAVLTVLLFPVLVIFELSKKYK